MIVRNEEQHLREKINNLQSLDYPPEKVNFVVISDASEDTTNNILSGIEDARFHCKFLCPRQGKASGLNRAMQAATGDIVVFTDARQIIERDAIRLLMQNFADETVGCVSGELMLGDAQVGEAARGLGLYWRIEKKIRQLESMSGSVVGATGALYAVRRCLLQEIPPETVLDDVYIPLNVARLGGRIVFDSRARAWDKPSLGNNREFARKVRTLSGNYQLLQLAPWLLSRKNPLRFEFVSHKLLRLIVPFALAAALLSSLLIDERLYHIAAILQLGFYTLSIFGLARVQHGRLARIADAALTFVMLNTAALVAFKNFVTRRRIAWS
jgi:cellulose synthase/poly-beta-1,6-N-acetylglucosamine synthase-like glycosyltransferase